jgi:hypothetical protein
MTAKLIIWLQLFAALLLLSDAYLPLDFRENLDAKLKAKVGAFSDSYQSRFLKRDLILFGLLTGSWVAFWLFGEAGRFFGSLAGPLGLWGVLVMLIWSITFLFLFSTAMAAFTQYFDSHLNLLIKFPLCFGLYKAPKGPIYALGFGLLVISHAIQLAIEYGKPA